jgi:hypothetical protein
MGRKGSRWPAKVNVPVAALSVTVMSVFRYLPVMWLPLALYLPIAISMGTGANAWLLTEALTVTMPSGDRWVISQEDLVIGFGILCLSVELVRSALPTGRSMVTLALVSVGLILGLILLLTVKGFATSAFFLILLLTLINFLVTGAIQVFTARRTLGFDLASDGRS